MKTDQLIKALALDNPERRTGLRQRLAAAAIAGLLLSATVFAVTLGPRADIAGALTEDARFGLKFLIVLTLAGAAGGLLLRLIRPGAGMGPWMRALLLAPAVVGLAVVYELMAMPAETWIPRLIGRNWLVCLTSIPLLAVPILAGLLLVLRQGAALRPALTGAVAGLAAGGLAATLYAAHCADDSPLFVATWYGIALALVAAVGALVGARWLRW